MRDGWKTTGTPLLGGSRMALLTALLVTLLLVLVPAAPVPGQEAGDETAEPRVEVEQDVKVKRVVLSAEDGDGLRMMRIPVGGEEGKTVRVVVRSTDEDGEVRTFQWDGEDAEELKSLGDGARVLFVPGVPRGFLGVHITPLTPELRTHFGAGEDRGVLVARVVPDSPAARAGLRVGDVLTHVDGQAVESPRDVTRRIGDRRDGEVVALEVVRDGRIETLNATVEVRERPQVEVGEMLRKLGGSGQGIDFEFDTEAFQQEMEEVRQFFGSEEWQREMEEMEVELRRELEEMEVELRELEQRLQEQQEEGPEE